MGILTLLRNAFGRSRKARTTEAEGAASPAEPMTEGTPAKPPADAPSPEPTAPAQSTATATPPKLPSPSPEPSPSPTASVPEPREEHDLVTEAFANITVPRPATRTNATEPTTSSEAGAKPEAVAEAQTEPEPETRPEAEAEAQPEAEAQAQPEQEAEAQAEPEAAPETTPAPTATPEPTAAAADGEEAPQGPPAPDDETRTGGAGGETPEGEAEAEPTPENTPAPAPTPEPTAAAADGEEAPQGPPAPDDETRTGGAGGETPEAEGEAEAEPAPANTPVPRQLRAAHRAAATALTKHNLSGTRAKVYLVLDRSASMRPYYKDGSAQALAEQTLALAAHLDPAPDPTVKVVFFSTELDGTGDLTLTDYEDKIDTLHAELGRMGRTSYHAAVEEVLALHDKTGDPTAPALVIFQTDGAPDAKTPATQSLTEAAKTHPSVFFSFVAFGAPENKAFDYLRKLRTPNTAHFLAGETPRELTDKQLYDGVLAGWRP